MRSIGKPSGKTAARWMLGAAVAAIASGIFAGNASAALSSALISDSFSNGLWTYNLSVTNSSPTATVGTFWFAWIPGQDYLTTLPTSTTSPAGWSVDQITHTVSTDGYAPRWVSTTALIQPDTTLSGFSFTTTDAPASIFGNSIFYSNPPTATFFTYPTTPFSAGGIESVATAVPEPVSMAIFSPLVLLLGRRRGKPRVTMFRDFPAQ